MQQGVITGDNFTQILRPISQRRQSGLLELTVGQDIYRISFERGKIVDVASGASPDKRLFAEWLSRRQGFALTEDTPCKSYDEVFRVVAGELSREEFVGLLNEYRKEVLYSFSPSGGALYNFRMEGAGIESDCSFNLTVNQYLLELSEGGPQKLSEAEDKSDAKDEETFEKGDDLVSFLEKAIDESFDVEPIQAEDFIADEQQESISEQDQEPSLSAAAEQTPQQSDLKQGGSWLHRKNNELLYSEKVPLTVMAIVLVSFLFFALFEWRPVFYFLGRV